MTCAPGLLRWGSSISSAEAAGMLIIGGLTLVLCKRIMVGGDGFKSESAIPGEDFGQWLADIIAPR